MDLNILGWNSFFAEHFRPYAGQGYLAGRVAMESKHIYKVYTEQGEMLAEISGKMRYHASCRSDYPAVGDWVVMTCRAGDDKATIHALLPRLSKFSRKVAGAQVEEQIVSVNIDTIFLVSALNNDYNIRRIERYLTMARDSGASPVIVLNKADLCSDVESRVAEVERIAPGVPIHVVSCVNKVGLEGLFACLDKPGHTAALAGSSGVGKSSLINLLTGRDMQRVNLVREGDDRGRHTTTCREMILLSTGGIIIDTPGMRELQLWDAGEGFRDAFADIEMLAGQCRYRDCRHEGEPRCAVMKALEEGSLDPSRYANYLKLQKELSFLAGKDGLDARLARKEKEKKLSKMQKRIKNR